MQAGDAGICTQGKVEGEADGEADESGGAADVRQNVKKEGWLKSCSL